MNGILNEILSRVILLPAILVGLTFHEYAHGQVASLLGDDTPALEGRLTINPLPHIDWIGFLMLLLAGFGWAKPVGVNPYKFEKINIRTGMMLVSLAGPAMNLALAFISMIAYKLMIPYSYLTAVNYGLIILEPFIWINLVLMLFNLLPVPPLDGSKILGGFLSESGNQKLESVQRYGLLILIILIVPIGNQSLIGLVLGPVLNAMVGLLDTITFFI